jgi:hypothetical protein
VGGHALQLRGGKLEGCPGATIGQVHGEYHRHTQRNARQRKHTLPGVAQEVAQAGKQQQGRKGTQRHQPAVT